MAAQDGELNRGNLLLLAATIGALLVITLFCVYLRWACRLRLQQTRRGLDPATIRSFPLQPQQGSSGECSICLRMLVEGVKDRVLPWCNHGFHPECVDKWLEKKVELPALPGSAAAGGGGGLVYGSLRHIRRLLPKFERRVYDCTVLSDAVEVGM